MEQFGSILFIDIETVPIQSTFGLLPEGMQAEWERKARLIKNAPDATPAEMYEDRGGIYSEFAKIVCISFGSIYTDSNGERKIKLKSIAGDDERQLLTDFCGIIDKVIARHKEIRFCGHNIKEFDMPFICRRMVINNVELPPCLQLSGKKPWEINHLDTMEMWKFGDNKNYTSLSLLAQVLGIPSPKGDIDGSRVAHVYWQERDIARIATYCMQDVLTAAKVFLRLRGVPDVGLTAVFAE